MAEQLIYRIAEEYILLYTPSAEATRELLPNYEPFLVPELPDGCEYVPVCTSSSMASAV